MSAIRNFGDTMSRLVTEDHDSSRGPSMKMPRQFISGFASAVFSLGQEGDARGDDWSAAYKYLQERLDSFEEETEPKQIDRIEAAIERIEDALGSKPKFKAEN